MTGESTKSPPLAPAERLSIVNALMAEDRNEIRERQEAVFRLTYYIVPGFIAIAAFSVEKSHLKVVLLLGQSLLLVLYVVAFFVFRKWLRDARACLQIREAFYKEQELLHADRFEPLRKLRPKDYAGRFEDNAVWFPFSVTLLSAVVLLTYMWLS